MASLTHSSIEASALHPDSGLARVLLRHAGPPAAHARLPVITEPASAAAASFRLLQYRLRHQAEARVVAVTSPERGEGKTTCAVNLALALAEQGEGNVLLVEANLQNPAISELLDFTPPCCVAVQLHTAGEQAHHQWQAVSAYFHNLHVLAVSPATKCSDVSGATLRAAMTQLRRMRYTTIVLDCPPTLGSAKMNAIADCVDGAFLTSVAKRTRKSKLSRSAETLSPLPVVGTLVFEDR